MRIVYKTKGAEKLDHYYSGIPEPLADALRKGRQLMTDNPAHLSDAAKPLENAGKLPADTANDLDKYFLAGPNGAEKERLIRHGYEQAIELANATDKPIETFVVAGAGNSNFEVHIAEGKHAVTVFMLVTENREYGSNRSGSRSWVVRVAGPGEFPKAQHLDLEDPPTVKIQVSGA
jgi:hypothetical protein